MNKLLDLDPFIAYQASAMLQEYIKQGCANYVLDSLNVHIDDATDPRILDLVHALMKFTRSQMKKGIEMDPNHLCRLLNLVIGDNGSRSGMFDSIDCPTVWNTLRLANFVPYLSELTYSMRLGTSSHFCNRSFQKRTNNPRILSKFEHLWIRESCIVCGWYCKGKLSGQLRYWKWQIGICSPGIEQLYIRLRNV